MNAQVADENTYPFAPGHRGIATSIEAADAVGSVSARYERLALARIKAAGEQGCTTVELANTLGVERSTIQPRTSELRRKHLIDDSGRRRPNPNGKRAIVWVATGGAA